ncbi:MAG: hypothetical protein HDR26_10095, partial [Lachnospiraceae bacterium]|nr:hypothetical protein [Lachnospiraceae bacterium]
DDPLGVPKMIARHKNEMSFTAYGAPFFTYKYKRTGLAEKDAETLLGLAEMLLAEMEEDMTVRKREERKPAEDEGREEQRDG